MNFKPYPKYKASGVEWLGDVPEEWARRRLRFGVQLNPSKSECSDLSRETMVSFLPMEAIGENGEIDLQRERPISEVETGYTYFRDGDVVMAKITPCFENGKGARVAGLTNGIGFGTTELIVTRSNGKMEGRYVQWLFMSQPFRKLGEGHMYGAGGQKRLPDDFVRNFDMAWPSTNEQSDIANFLDRETVKIDTLIAKQEAMIELLKEKRQAVISHAVTKGLNPSMQTKLSDTPDIWIEEVPTHWEVIRIKWVARMESGHTPDKKISEYWENCDIPWVSLNDTGYLKDHDYISETAYQVNELGIANSSARLLPSMTVVFSRDATIGRCAITTRPMAVSQHFIAWICSERILPEFLLRSLRSMTQELNRLTTGATLKTIGMSDVKTLRCALPPLAEQVEIVEFIQNSTQQIDTLIAKAQQAIVLQKEHRTALISAAVTGKIDVRTQEEARKAA